jgi:hypothetical protein
VSHERRTVILCLYVVGVACQGTGTVWAFLNSYRETVAGLMPRDNAHGWREKLRRARPLIFTMTLLVTGLALEIAGTVTWLYSS